MVSFNLGDALAQAVYRQTDEGLGFENDPQTEVEGMYDNDAPMSRMYLSYPVYVLKCSVLFHYSLW